MCYCSKHTATLSCSLQTSSPLHVISVFAGNGKGNMCLDTTLLTSAYPPLTSMHRLVDAPLTASGVPPQTAVGTSSGTLTLDDLLGAPPGTPPTTSPPSGSNIQNGGSGGGGSSKAGSRAIDAVKVAVPVTVGCAVIVAAALFGLRTMRRSATIDPTPTEPGRIFRSRFSYSRGPNPKPTSNLRTLLSLGTLEREAAAQGFDDIGAMQSPAAAPAAIGHITTVTSRVSGRVASGTAAAPSAPPQAVAEPPLQQQQAPLGLPDIFARAAAAAPRWGRGLPPLQVPAPAPRNAGGCHQLNLESMQCTLPLTPTVAKTRDVLCQWHQQLWEAHSVSRCCMHTLA